MRNGTTHASALTGAESARSAPIARQFYETIERMFIKRRTLEKKHHVVAHSFFLVI